MPKFRHKKYYLKKYQVDLYGKTARILGKFDNFSYRILRDLSDKFAHWRRRSRPFFWRFDYLDRRPPRKILKWKQVFFKVKRILFKYYGNLNNRRLRAFAKYFSKKHYLGISDLNKTIIYYMELRIQTLLFRFNFFTNIVNIFYILRNKIIHINKKLVVNPLYQVKIFDIIELDISLRIYLYHYIKKKLRKQRFFPNLYFNTPGSYLFINYKCMFGFPFNYLSNFIPDSGNLKYIFGKMDFERYIYCYKFV